MHSLGHGLAVGHSLDNRSRALDGVAAGKDAGDAGAADLVGLKQAAGVGFQVLLALRDGGAGALTDGDYHAVRRVELFGAGQLGQGAVLGLLQITEDNALVGDFHRLFIEDEVDALQLGIAGLILAGRDMLRQREALQMPCAVADGRAGHIHRRVARADNDYTVAQMVDIGVLQIVDGVVHVAKAFALDVQRVGPPYAGADEDCLVAVAEQILDLERLAHIGVGAHLDALQAQMTVLKIVQHRLWQAEFRDAVAQHAADFIMAFKNRDIVAIAGQNDGNRQTRRAGADNRGLFAVGRSRALHHLAGVGGGNVVLNNREMHRRALDAADAVTLALVLVVADQRTDRGQGVILKQHTARLVQLVVFQQTDNLGDVGVNRAALLAAGHLAAKAVVRFVHYVQRHVLLLISYRFCALRMQQSCIIRIFSPYLIYITTALSVNASPIG